MSKTFKNKTQYIHPHGISGKKENQVEHWIGRCTKFMGLVSRNFHVQSSSTLNFITSGEMYDDVLDLDPFWLNNILLPCSLPKSFNLCVIQIYVEREREIPK